MRFDLVIFDCDGVLIDSEIIACTVDAEAITSLGYPMTTEQVADQFVGMSDDAVGVAFERLLQRKLPDGFRDKANAIVKQRYETDLHPIDGVEQVLRRLSLPKCVASSAHPTKLDFGLKKAGFYDLLAPNIFPTSLVPHPKPAPDIFLYAAEAMGVPPAKTIVVEDSPTGVTGAVAAGMTCIGFCGGSHCGYGHADKLRAAGADQVIHHMDELLAILHQA